MTPDTIPKMVFAQIERFRDRTVMLHKVSGRYTPISWQEFGSAVREVAAGLIKLGVAEGARVAIMAPNGPKWAIADTAILAAGAISVPLYHTSTSVQAEHILRQSGAHVAFVGRSEKASMLMSCSPTLARIIAMEGPGGDAGTCALDFDSLRILGAAALDTDGPSELERRMDRAKPDDCATIIYTSGTTGDPRGVMLSHRNILANAVAGISAQPVWPDDIFLSFLPLSHVFERTVGQFLAMMAGATIAYAENIRRVAENIQEVRPTIMLGVPRFFEKLHGRILDAIAAAPAFRRKLFLWAMQTGSLLVKTKRSGGRAGAMLRVKHLLADRLVLKKLRNRLGGRLGFFVSGGAPLPPKIAEFFLAAGVEILEGYGLTETSPVIAVNPKGALKPGTVGLPLPGVEVKIADDGEIATRSPCVMLGYYRDEAATAEVIRDGWLHTGDLGDFDDDGYLRVTGRKKELIVMSNGKKVAPHYVESLIASDRLIEQVMLHGEGRKYLTALVVPDFEAFREEFPETSLAAETAQELSRNEGLRRVLMDRIRERTKGLASFERVKKILVTAEPLSQENGLLTPTLKVKRKEVAARYGKQLEALYDTERERPPVGAGTA